MFFLSPLALLGLAVALVPPLLHLFQRRHPPAFEFPALRYLRQTEREAERTLKLRHLLLLRVAAVVAIVLAAARPVVPRGSGGLHEPTAVAIVLDNSLSSGAVSGGRRVLDDLARRARETLRAAQAGDALWVIGADGVARRGSREQLLDLVTRMQPEARRLDIAAAALEGARLVTASGYARGEVHVLTDFQATAIGSDSAAGAPRDSSAAGVAVLVYHPAADPPPNRGILAVRPEPALWLAGSGRLVVTVGGGPRPSGSAAVTASLGGRQGARALADSGEVQLEVPVPAPGWRTGDVSLEADELRADDHRAFAVRVVPPAAVAIDPTADPGTFVREALATLAEAHQVTVGGGVLVGGPPARAGRIAIVFPPDDPSQVGAIDRRLLAGGATWRFGERVSGEDSLIAPLLPELAGARVLVRFRLVGPGGGDSAAVLARVNGEPWLVRDGAVILVGSRLVPDQTNLPLLGGFVPFVSALVNRVARGESGVVTARPGEQVTLPARATGLLLAADSSEPVVGGAVAAPAAPGVYAIVAGADTVALLVVAPDGRESDLRRATPARLAAVLPGALLTVTDDPRAYAARRFRGSGRTELTGWLLAAALALLLVESAVATGRLSRRS